MNNSLTNAPGFGYYTVDDFGDRLSASKKLLASKQVAGDTFELWQFGTFWDIRCVSSKYGKFLVDHFSTLPAAEAYWKGIK